MTREEAKRRMECCRDFLANNYSDMGEPNFTAFNMAIEALSAEPCEDCISRHEVLDNYNGVETPVGYRKVVDIEVIKNMKSVQPKPKTDVLDKIRAEIEQNAYPIVHGVNNYEKGMTLYGILEVIDKYKAESEE